MPTKLRDWIVRKWKERGKSQYLPTQNDIKATKPLAERLKGKTNSETLNNILEWQDKNLYYWWERFLFDMPRLFLLVLGILSLIILSLPFLIVLFSVNKTLFLVSLTAIFCLGIAFLFSRLIGKIYYLFIGIPIVYFAIILLIKLPALLSYFLPYVVFYFVVISIFAFIIYYLNLRYRKVEKKSFLEIFEDTFKFSLEIEKILRYRMAICRDYAKLTAALLLNLYPKNKIYFYTFLGHVATGIEINGKTYILDQKLPIVNEQAWLNGWNKDKATKLESIQVGNKLNVKYLKSINREEKIELKTEKELIKLLDNVMKGGKKKVVYVLKNRRKIYDINDKIIRESLLRYYTSLLQRKLVGNFSKIKNLNITEKGNDIILNVSLR